VRQHEGLLRKLAMERVAEMHNLVDILNAGKRVHYHLHQFSGGIQQ
jgi:ABC-type microcin C transport system duplicated ATPase subunit YejF